MITLYIVVEGPTEEAFVKSVLVAHLRTFDVEAIPIIVHTGKVPRSARVAKGGGDWGKWRDILLRLSRDGRAEVAITTLVDLYAFPKKLPGLAELNATADTRVRAERLELAMASAVPNRRFIPYVQRHEIEALVLVDLDPLEDLLESDEDRKGLAALRAEIAGMAVEDINDGPDSAPSKRLERYIPGYTKTLHGPLVVGDVGLARIRAACPRFDAWVRSLEALGTPPQVEADPPPSPPARTL